MDAHILAYLADKPLAITPEYVAVIRRVLMQRSAGIRFTPAEIEARISAARGDRVARPSSSAQIGVIPIVGVIMHRMELLTDVSSSGTSPDAIARAFRAALNDPNVESIILDIDSPGGSVYGLPELADEIRAARGRKPIVAVANGIAASAAYWLGSAASEFVVTPSGQVGSIGVVSVHEDVSKMLDDEGIKVSMIHFGKFKVEGNPFQPLDADARKAIQADVDHYGEMFIAAVANGRGVPSSRVRSEYGQGRMIVAQEATRRGMVDRVETFDQVIARLSGSAPARLGSGARALVGSDYARSRIAIARARGREHGVM